VDFCWIRFTNFAGMYNCIRVWRVKVTEWTLWCSGNPCNCNLSKCPGQGYHMDFMMQRGSDNWIVNTDKKVPFSILDVTHLLFIFFLNESLYLTKSWLSYIKLTLIFLRTIKRFNLPGRLKWKYVKLILLLGCEPFRETSKALSWMM
jgi:hypothetical protein